MKSDNTTLAAGYAAVLGFNLRQLKRAVLGKVRPIEANNPKMGNKSTITDQMLTLETFSTAS